MKSLMKTPAIGLITVILAFFMLTSTAVAANINLSVAASMKDIANLLADSYSQKNPNTNFIKNYGSSGSVAKQIANGAPADIFISANVKWMNYLKDKKIMDNNSIDVFAYNELVFAGKPGTKVSRMEDLATLEKIAIGSPQSVPAGEYAMAALVKSGMDKKLQKKLVMAKDVRVCLVYAERGEVDGSFVYKTDVLQAAKSAKVIFIVPQELYPQIAYPKGLTATGSKNKEAVDFFRFLNSAEARKALEESGFTVR